MFDFTPTVEQRDVLEAVRSMMDRLATEDYLREHDEGERYPYELYEQLVAMGLPALPFPEEYGGLGRGILDFALVAEEIGRKGYDLAAVYGIPIFNALTVLRHGGEEQKRRWIPELIAGRVRFAVAITEPGSGSDAGSMRTTARRVEGGWLVSGEKVFCSGAAVDDTVIALYCRTDPQAPRQSGLGLLLVDNRSPGLEIRALRTLGRHMLPTTQLLLDDVFVPEDRLVGRPGDGWACLLGGLQLERIVTSCAYVGNAQTVVDEALAYAKQREQFGRRIGDFQVIAHMLADMQTEVDAARLLTYRAAWVLDQGRDALLEISMAKLFGSEAFLRVANDGMQILGGYGYTMEMPMQRHLRAARGSTITAGTSQIQRDAIARRLGLRPR
jgi:alkylation response protein AidB-like acyl-CoA dehydrogenase